MKRASFIFLIAGLVALASFGMSYFAGKSCCDTGKPGSELEWLRQTFQLTDTQFQSVKALHESYQPTCERLCQRITAANEKLDLLIQSNQSLTPELENALRESSAVREDCRKAMMEQIYRVAAEMSPESRKKYLNLTKSRIIVPAMGQQPGTQTDHCLK